MKIKGLYRMPGSRFYWYRWTEAGKRFAVSLKTDDLPIAIKKVEDLQAGRTVARWEQQRATPVTVAARLVQDYVSKAQARAKKPMRARTARKQGAVLKKFLKDMGISDIHQITPATLTNWLGTLGEGGASKDTRHTYARVVKTFVGYLIGAKLVRGDLHDQIDVPERGAVGRKNWLKNKEVERVIAETANEDLRFILFCGFHAGLRRNEIVNAKVNWFDLQAGLVHVQNDPKSGFVLKDRENRSIPISKPFNKFLREFLVKRSAGEYALRPAKLQGAWVYRYDFSRAWKTHMKRCGVTCTIHDARRSFASNLVSAGESIFIVAKWLGDGVQVVERSYGHLAPSAGNINRLTAKLA
jgi:integrase